MSDLTAHCLTALYFRSLVFKLIADLKDLPSAAELFNLFIKVGWGLGMCRVYYTD
jgi:hypothetical protein